MTHPIEAAIAGLVAVWGSAPELLYDVDGVHTQLEVVDDPFIGEGNPRRLLYIGTSAEYLPGGTQASAGYDLAGQRVQVEVTCELRVWSGSTDAASDRVQALDVVVVLERLLARDPALGGGVDWARVVRTTYEPGQTEDGALAVVEITVRADATRDHPE